MNIKHMPSGLFPHIDSGLERKPLYPLLAEMISIGCRLDDGLSDARMKLVWKFDGIEMPEVEGVCTSQNDMGQRYFSFTIQAPDKLSEVEYSFIAQDSNGEVKSAIYRFELLREIRLEEPTKIVVRDNEVWAIYENETNRYRLKVEIKNNIRIFFEDYLTDKVVVNDNNYSIDKNIKNANNANNDNDYIDDIEDNENNENIKENKDSRHIKNSKHNTDSIDNQTQLFDQEFANNTEIEYILANGFVIHVKQPFTLTIEKGGKKVAEYTPSIRLWIDRKNRSYQIEQKIGMEAAAFYGFGEKFDRVNQKGLSPLSYVVEQYANQQEKTYLPIPFFFTDCNIGFLQLGTWRTQFFLDDELKDNWTQVRLLSRCPRDGRLFDAFLFTGTPADIIKSYTSLTGKSALPPRWAFGPWMSSNGWNTQKEALEQVEYMKQLSIPATVMVLEAWSDEETFYIWNDAKYTPRSDGSPFTYQDFTFLPDGKWPNPKEFVEQLHENGLELILWQIPVVKYEAGTHGEQLDLDTEYAINQKLCVHNEEGSPYRITEMWFGNSLIPDFSKLETCKWWFDKRSYLLTELGVAGFKTDGGEFLFDERACFSDGRSVEEAHNDFPNLYEGAYHEFMKKTMGEGKGITFSRAGYTGAQKYPIHWAGDQVSTFPELKGQIKAGLSLGLSGVPFWGFDIGGFAGDFPSTELYLRSTAFAAFAPVMQFHSEPRYGQYYMTERNHWNNDRSPWNMAEANKDPSIIEYYRLFANLRMNMMPYLWQEAQYCAETSRPMMAHLIYDFPEEHEVLAIEDEYMLGRDLLVAPIITKGDTDRVIWLPPGNWYDFWTGERIEGGLKICYQCDLSKIPVFVREGAILPLNLNRNFIMGSTGVEATISNDLNQYENLCMFVYGEGNIKFVDEMGTVIEVITDENSYRIEGIVPKNLTIIPMDDKMRSSVEVNGSVISVEQKEVTVFRRKCYGYQVLHNEF